jgi:hypothetical protein
MLPFNSGTWDGYELLVLSTPTTYFSIRRTAPRRSFRACGRCATAALPRITSTFVVHDRRRRRHAAAISALNLGRIFQLTPSRCPSR